MEPECFVCNNCHLICCIYEHALQQGYEAEWGRVEDTPNLWMVEVYAISRTDLENLVNAVRTAPGQLTLELASA